MAIIVSFWPSGAQPEATELLWDVCCEPGGKQEAVWREDEPPTGINANAKRKGETEQWDIGVAAGEQHTASKGANHYLE